MRNLGGSQGPMKRIRRMMVRGSGKLARERARLGYC